MYINLNADFLEKTKANANKEAIAEMGEGEQEGKNKLLYPETKQDIVESIEIEYNKITIAISNELGWFDFTIPLDTNTLEQILSVVIKRMNKIKSILESLK
jgi:hypothetical protein